jgi:hypothetical protein
VCCLFALLALMELALALLGLTLRHVLLLRGVLRGVRFHDLAFPCLTLTQLALSVCVGLLLLWSMCLLQCLRDAR